MIKILGIGGLGLALLIFLLMVAGLVSERESTRDEAIREIGASWAYEQRIAGPFLCVPFKPLPLLRGGKVVERAVDHAVFLPEEMNIEGNLEFEVRRRGIFETVVYRAELRLEGHFVTAEFDRINAKAEEFRWQDAVLSLGISDNRGIEGKPRLQWGERPATFQPSPAQIKLVERGIHAPVSVDRQAVHQPFVVELTVRGTRSLFFSPTASITTAMISSPWPDPGFVGAFLPAQRNVSDDGFQASWNLSQLARSFPQMWTICKSDSSVLKSAVRDSYFGVKLLQSVDLYRKVMRSVKYGVLFIGFTFLCFFLFETLAGLRIHPIQYTAVGAALCVFYLLLLSLAEHLGFGKAFLIASTANILVISAYSKAFLGATRRFLALGGMLSGLYLFLYVLLQVEDYALLVGSLGVFLALTFFMYLTRRLNWYDLLRRKTEMNAPEKGTELKHRSRV